MHLDIQLLPAASGRLKAPRQIVPVQVFRCWSLVLADLDQLRLPDGSLVQQFLYFLEFFKRSAVETDEYRQVFLSGCIQYRSAFRECARHRFLDQRHLARSDDLHGVVEVCGRRCGDVDGRDFFVRQQFLYRSIDLAVSMTLHPVMSLGFCAVVYPFQSRTVGFIETWSALLLRYVTTADHSPYCLFHIYPLFQFRVFMYTAYYTRP